MALPNQCPLCLAGHDAQSVVTRHVYGDESASRAFFHCEACDVRYQFPGLTPEEEARFYAAEFEGFMSSRSGDAGGWLKTEQHLVANESTRLRRMKYLAPFLVGASDVLEVGCSSGFMLYPLAEAGHRCTGIEPSGVFSEFVRGRGLPVYQSLGQLQQEVPQAQFDLILHFFVLEHIADPLAFLKDQLKMLRPGGRIIFEIPNAADPLYSVYDIPEFERFYWSIAHPWYFSEASLRFLLDQLGGSCEILRDQRYDLSNHMVWARNGRPGGMGRFTELLGEDVEESYKQSLIRSGKCDTLVGIISKE
ncbi:class I SAM-dependent methyltransferase [Dechloromonas denitrificans]|uniref:class I SAM-dependent methyltransferase n=1 Tax=Dechloromonas denitrificans TaxID=281362 RepID=UPI001CF8F7CB|nr:class I SAM-dependent methyltransferase [Dechloromonas denitrificans]UCV10570.1 class I SAM-dependent methyltransferase [Dechloromonas denitrificans]